MKTKIKWFLKKLVLIYYRILTFVLPLRKDVVVFTGSLGRSPFGSPRAICDKMIEEGLDRKYKLYYILDNPGAADIGGNVVKVKNSRLRFYYVMAVAGIWVCDTRLQNYIIKRKGVVYIQTWHGTPLKKLALDMNNVEMAESRDIESYKREFVKNSASWDYLVSQNPFSTEVFKRAFAFKKNIVECGYPRNDVLFYGNTPAYKEKLRRKYNIPDGKKVMLYAPTWRDNKYYNNSDYKFETELEFSKMKEHFCSEWVLLAKYHYMVKDNKDYSEYDGFVMPMKAESDIAELYLISDILITDYSSVMFDYSILGKPMFFYVFDYESYKNELRGFYFDLAECAPGPLVNDTASLIAAIDGVVNGNESEKYKPAYDEFVKRFNPFDNGSASEKIADIIKSSGK